MMFCLISAVLWMGGQLMPAVCQEACVPPYLQDSEQEQVFTGRILMPDGLSGAEGIEVRLRIYLQENHMVRTYATTDAEGRFTAPLWLPGGVAKEEWGDRGEPIPYWARVSYGKTRTWDSPEPHLNLGERENPWALGDFLLKERKFFWLEVKDEEGEPIPGAIANSFYFSDPTDGKGRSKVYVDRTSRWVDLACPGYRNARQDLPEDPDGVLEFTLQRSAWLSVELDVPPGVDLRGTRMELSSVDRIFDTEYGAPEKVDGMFHGHFLRSYGGLEWWKDGGGKSIWGMARTQREFSLWNLALDSPLQVALIDRFGAELCSADTIFRSADKQVVHLKPKIPIRVFRGKVVDAAGQPLEGVQFEFNERPSWPEDSTTDAEGYFHYQGVGSEAVDIRVGKAGHATLVDHAFPVPLDGSEVLLQLDSPRCLQVTVQDAAGRPLEDVFLTRDLVSIRNEATSLGEGRFFLEDLPKTPVALRIHAGGMLQGRSIPSGMESLQVEFPQMGEVRVRIARFRGEEEMICAVQLLPAGDATERDQKSGLHEGGQRKDFLMSARSAPMVTHFDAVLPGDYVLQISVWDKRARRYQPRERIGPFKVLAGEVRDCEKTIRPR